MSNAYQLTNVSFQYETKTVLTIDNLSIAKNQTTAIIGANGVGKSTLLTTMAFLQAPSSGKVYFFDKTCDFSATALRRKVAFLAQKPYFLCGTVADNIALALKLRGICKPKRKDRVAHSLERVNISNLAKRQFTQLSSGEKRKAAIARALALDAEVLIFDEPFSGLDKKSTELIERLIVDCKKTLLFSGHGISQAEPLADCVVQLS